MSHGSPREVSFCPRPWLPVRAPGLCWCVELTSAARSCSPPALPSPACSLDVVLGFDGSRDQNVFAAQKGLESKVEDILRRISQMPRLSCSGGQSPAVRVSVVASTPSGPVEAFEFSEYQPELLEKFRNMRSQHPYVLTADTLKAYGAKLRQSSPNAVKVRAPGLGSLCARARRGGRHRIQPGTAARSGDPPCFT